MSRVFKSPLIALLAVFLGLSPLSHATDVARTALQSEGVAKPNVIFGMDDSGSMDFEVMLNTNDGAFWWNSTAQSGWSGGQPLFGDSSLNKFAYLFPNGCGTLVTGGKHLCDSGQHYAIPPTYQFASMRSSAYNPLYYDPAKTYLPWSDATVSGSSKNFGVSDKQALYEPLLSPTLKLDEDFLSNASEFGFRLLPGMVLPVGANVWATNKWVTQTSATAITTSNAGDYKMGYYPATYWMPGTCTIDNVSCTKAPDGVVLKRYEIKSSTASYPSGRTYAAELQNFANWFTYYRKRRLMLAASMGKVMDSLTSMRVGVVDFNGNSAVTMYDTDSTDVKANGQVIAGHFYTNGASGGTPTRQTLKYIGEQFRTNKNVVQYSCQRNAAFIVTDGFATVTTTTPPAYSQSTYGSGAPYTTTTAGTLADISLSYYTNNLRSDLPAGRVPAAAANNPNPAADKNTDPHMNTYAITLGANGTVWPARSDAYTGGALAWPNPNVTGSPTSIDDLWHATVNGRGMMLRATNPDETASAMQSVLTEILKLAGAQNGVAFSTVNVTPGDAVAYVGSYRPQGWSGDVGAFSVDAASGGISDTRLWSADTQLNALAWTTRKIFTFNGSAGAAFTAANVGSQVNVSSAYGTTANMMNYLRGDRSMESSTYRVRTGLMGAVVNAEPVVDRVAGLIYGTTNEGMVHAFDKDTGDEKWAYVPGYVLSTMGAQTAKNWTFQTMLDATPTLAAAGAKRILVGGRGTAGSGYYALDVTTPTGTEGQLAGKVLWEFPNSSSAANVKSAMGTSVGKPLVVNTTKYGWVVLVTSGYNSTRDGKGRLYVLDATTGAIKLELATTAGSVGTGDAGFAQVSGFQEPDGTVHYVYGGDELGNVWRFDLEAGAVTKLASLVNAAGAALPVTAAPELGKVGGRRMVYVGTGRLLGVTDFSDTSVNTMFGIWDNDSAVTNVRTQLAKRTMTTGTTRRVTGTAIDWSTQRGWYVDLPAGEKAHTDPALAYGILTWTSNKPSLTSCSSTSVLYVADAASGLEAAANMFPASVYYGVELSSTLASRVGISRLRDGSIVVTTHQSDNTTTSHRLLPQANVVARKNAWKEVRR